MREREKHMQAIGNWAGTLPEEAWTPGAPLLDSMDYQRPYRFFAVKTETGRILSGTGLAFRPENCQKMAAMPKYGRVTHHVEVGD